jgi:rare lipoprotein A (peptidoglycan hydrolase)
MNWMERVEQWWRDVTDSYAFCWGVIFVLLVIFWIGLFSVVGIIKAHAEETSLKASWYSVESLKREGTWKNGTERKMANGQKFDENKYTAATRLYPLGTTLKVRNINNNREVRVKVCDRIGKRFATTRIDLSKGAFAQIASLKQGLVSIKVEVVK